MAQEKKGKRTVETLRITQNEAAQPLVSFCMALNEVLGCVCIDINVYNNELRWIILLDVKCHQ